MFGVSQPQILNRQTALKKWNLLNEVHQNGRNPYKTGFKADPRNIGFQFVPIEHQSIENEVEVSFEQWKLNIETVILH
jgi:hypothetical protein